MFEFLNPRRTKSIQYIGLKFFGTVNRAVPFQHSELMTTNVFVAPSETVSLMLMRQIWQMKILQWKITQALTISSIYCHNAWLLNFVVLTRDPDKLIREHNCEIACKQKNANEALVIRATFFCLVFCFIFAFIYLFPKSQQLQIFFQQLSYRRTNKVWFTEVNNDTIFELINKIDIVNSYLHTYLTLIILLVKIVSSKIFHFSLSKFVLFDLKHMCFSVSYLMTKILMKWHKEGNVSLHRQVHKKDSPKITI